MTIKIIIINEYIGILQFFTRQNFPNLDLSKFSTIKNFHHMVVAVNVNNYDKAYSNKISIQKKRNQPDFPQLEYLIECIVALI